MIIRRYGSLHSTILMRAVLACLCLATILLAPQGFAQAASASLAASAQVNPTVVIAGGTLHYTLTVDNGALSTVPGAAIAFTLPAGFSYVPGSTSIRRNSVDLPGAEPALIGNVLHWSGQSIPQGRSGSFYGLHTMLQDRCDTANIGFHLDRVREIMGEGAYVKQLFYPITAATMGPAGCWVTFVNGCYDRNLIPVVRLAGPYGGAFWLKPPADAPGDYTSTANAFARVVSGLPRREGRKLYVEIWNEPNLDIEWSGAANPVEYAHLLVDSAAAIRALGDQRIVLLNGALSPSGNYHNLAFIDAMATVPGAMQAFDIWSSHPYPGNHPPEYNIHDNTAPIYPELTIDSYLLELDRLAAHGRGDVQVLLTETGYALGQNNFGFQGYAPINESNRADYISRAFRDYWSQWPEVLGVCPYELVDPFGQWQVWDWLYPSGARHQQADTVRAMDKTAPALTGKLVIQFQARAALVAGTYAGRLQVQAPGVTSLDLNNIAPVQVMPAPATPTATATPTAAGSPTPTFTPTPPPVCSEILLNGGFETDEGWELPQTAYRAGYQQEVVHAGARAMRVGIAEGAPVYSWSAARQAVLVPDDSSSVRISFWYWTQSSAPEHGQQYVLLLDESRDYLETILWVAEDVRQWRQVNYELRGYAGRTLWLHLGAYNDGQQGLTAMFVDDVTLAVCRPSAATVTPTFSPTPSLTPAASATPTMTAIKPAHTATATPTPSATRTPHHCQEHLVNGDLETLVGWTILQTAYPARLVSSPVYEGQQAMALGILDMQDNTNSYSSVDQKLTLPTQGEITLSFWYLARSDDLIHDLQYVLLLDAEGDYDTLMWTTSNAGVWQRFEANLSASAGEQVTLRLGVKNDGLGGITSMIVDDVSIQSCSTTPLPTATPSPTFGPTLPPRAWLPMLQKGASRAEAAVSEIALPFGMRAAVPYTEGLSETGTPMSLTIDPVRQRLFLVQGSRLRTVDALTGRPLYERSTSSPIGEVAVQPHNGSLWVCLPDAGEMLIISASHRLEATLTDLGRPTSVLVTDERAYITDLTGRRVIVLDTSSHAIISQRVLANPPHLLALDQSRHRLYVGDVGQGAVQALDADTLHLMGSLELPGLGLPQAMILTPAGDRLLVALDWTPKYGAVVAIDSSTMRIVAETTGNRQQPLFAPQDLLLAPDARLALLTTPLGTLIMDAETLVVLKTVAAPQPGEWDQAVLWQRDTLIIADARGQVRSVDISGETP